MIRMTTIFYSIATHDTVAVLCEPNEWYIKINLNEYPSWIIKFIVLSGLATADLLCWRIWLCSRSLAMDIIELVTIDTTRILLVRTYLVITFKIFDC